MPHHLSTMCEVLIVLVLMSCSPNLVRGDVASGEQVVTNQTSRGNQTERPTSPSLEELAAKDNFYKIGRNIQAVCTPIIVCIGMIGNTLSFIVMIQRTNRRISCCIYMAIVSICDMGAILLVFAYWLSTDGTKNLWTDQQCKLVGYFFCTFAMTSVILVMFMTIDRFIAVRFPLHAKHYCTTSRAKKICIGMILIMTVLQLPHLRYYKQNDKVCQGFGFKDSWALVFAWLTIIFNSIIPSLVILVLNGLIIVTVRAHKKACNRNIQRDATGSHERQMVAMLLMVASAMLIFTVPRCIFYIISLIIDYKRDPHTYALYKFSHIVCAQWFYINYSINFFLYCLVGTKFRKDLKNIFIKGWCASLSSRSMCCKRAVDAESSGAMTSASTTSLSMDMPGR